MDLYTEFSENSDFDYLQSEEIKCGIKKGLTVACYAKPQYSSYTMRQIRKGLEEGIDLTPYAEYEVAILHQIRKAALAGVDVIPYVKEGYQRDQLDAIRLALTHKLPINDYINKYYQGACIKEIVLGLMQGLDVSVYANIKYSWRKMREIRLGMYHRVDVSEYSNYYYSYWQMKEIRLGLEAGIDVSSYKSFMYTAKRMHLKRLELEYSHKEATEKNTWRTLDTEHCKIYISSDSMHAYVEITDEKWHPTSLQVRALLKKNGICFGINDVGVADIVSHVNIMGRPISIANGIPPENGADGYYLYNFDTRPDTVPKQLNDGSADFESIKLFERVCAGQTLATYYPATKGSEGTSILGNIISAKRGRELPHLKGSGFVLQDDGRTYSAQADGHVRLHKLTLIVENLLVIDEPDAFEKNIDYDGSIYICSSVDEDYHISASGDIVIDKCIQDCCLSAGRNILIRHGMNAGHGLGMVEAGMNIMGGYFESSVLNAGKNIYFTSSINSELNAKGGIITFGKKGGIAGGTAYAEKGFCISNAGNSAGRDTLLCLGVNSEMRHLYEEYASTLQTADEELQKLENTCTSLRTRIKYATPKLTQAYSELENALNAKKIAREQINSKLDKVKRRAERAMSSQIIVDHKLYENVYVSINNTKYNPGVLFHSVIKPGNDNLLIEKI
jgi:uncharacterized protein (DUF342 family)